MDKAVADLKRMLDVAGEVPLDEYVVMVDHVATAHEVDVDILMETFRVRHGTEYSIAAALAGP